MHGVDLVDISEAPAVWGSSTGKQHLGKSKATYKQQLPSFLNLPHCKPLPWVSMLCVYGAPLTWCLHANSMNYMLLIPHCPVWHVQGALGRHAWFNSPGVRTASVQHCANSYTANHKIIWQNDSLICEYNGFERIILGSVFQSGVVIVQVKPIMMKLLRWWLQQFMLFSMRKD